MKKRYRFPMTVRPGAAFVLILPLGLANVAAWAWAWGAFAGNPVLLGTAALAYSFGLRHAVDADHIAAIDNATRKLIEVGRPAATTGLYFSLGHASVVIVAALTIATASAELGPRLAWFAPLADALATSVSALCLFALAAGNAVVLAGLLRMRVAMRRGEPPADTDLRRLLERRGLLGRTLRGVFGLVSRSRHMYWVGVLFGLGFDTATEIGLLAVSAVQAAHGLPLPAIMVFPALFAAGMALVDTLDALLMAGAYRWAAAEPFRRLRYNLVVTAVSVFVAVAIGGIELLGLNGGEASGANPVWRLAARLDDHSAAIGATVIAVFAVSWLVAMLLWRAGVGRAGAIAPGEAGERPRL